MMSSTLLRLAARRPSSRMVPARNFWFKSGTTDKKLRASQKINWANPSERLPYMSEESLFALPAMAKPFKQSDGVIKWYQIRARLIWGLFLLSGFSYAAYLHLNDRGQGRLKLLSSAPALARWLQSTGLLQPLPQAVGCAVPTEFHQKDSYTVCRQIWTAAVSSVACGCASQARMAGSLCRQRKPLPSC